MPYLTPVRGALLLTVVLVLWLLLGAHYQSQTEAPSATATEPQTHFSVQTRLSTARLFPAHLKLQGQLSAWHQVEVKAQISGKVERLLVQQGQTVKQNTPLLHLSDEGRQSRLQQAEALLSLRQSELHSAKALQQRQFVSETELARLTNELRLAETALTEAKLAIAHQTPVAPFTGVLGRRLVEPGALVQPGQSLFQLLEIARLKASAQVPQQQVAALTPGQKVTISLLDGRSFQGELSFISPAADSATRSYYIEASMANPDLLPLAGASASLSIELATQQAHAISPALLKLDPQGRLGLYTVEQGKVAFYPVQLLSADNNLAWVTGLPEQSELITLGAGFVEIGQQVQVVREATP
jgi:multidrug efflux system membrane fusion protein